MPNKTTQKIFSKENIYQITVEYEDGHSISYSVNGFKKSLLYAQQQQEDYQEILDLELMKDEDKPDFFIPELERVSRNKFRKELRQAIAEKQKKGGL